MNILRKKAPSRASKGRFAAFRRSAPEANADSSSNTWGSWRKRSTIGPSPESIESTENRESPDSTVVQDQNADLELAAESVPPLYREESVSGSDISEKSVVEAAKNEQQGADQAEDLPLLHASSANGASVHSPAEKSSGGRSSTLLPLDIDVPSKVGRYVVGARLGSGTCGVVHRALDDVLGREIAIKLSPCGDVDSTPAGKVPGAQRAYQTEVYAAGRLRHPNIVTVFNSGQFEKLNFIAMEVVNGSSLKSYGKGQKLLPTYRALEIICECCKALDYSHRQDILHRDIKPANIMVDDDGSVKLLDFGIAVGLSEDSGLSRRGPTLGTPNYMSPEQILGKTLSPSSDFYSIGTVLFELLTGKQLFKAKKVKDLFRTVVHQPAPTLIEFRPDLPRALSDALAKALSKKPENRFQSGIEMIDALSGFIESFKVIEQISPEQKWLLPVLGELSFFESFSDSDIARLLAHSKVSGFEPGERLMASGDTRRNLLLIVDGTVAAQSKKILHRVYGPGECVGELGFIHGTREALDVIALTKLQTLEISANTLAALPPRLHLHYYKKISDILVSRISSQQDSFTPDYNLG